MREDKKLELYRQGYNDKDIGKMLGCSTEAVRVWRERKGLPIEKVPMHLVLDPGEQEEVLKFFSYLLKYADLAASKNTEFKVGRFMKEYRRLADNLEFREVKLKR